MFISWGYSTKFYPSELLYGFQCPHCSSSTLRVHHSHKIFKVYGIPFFPYEKDIHVICDNCQTAYETSQFDLAEYKFKTPKGYFFGLIAAVIIIIFSLISLTANAKESLKILNEHREHPAVGDIFVFKSQEINDVNHPYSYFQIKEIKTEKGNTKYICKISNAIYKSSTDTIREIEKYKISLSDEVLIAFTPEDMKSLEMNKVFVEQPQYNKMENPTSNIPLNSKSDLTHLFNQEKKANSFTK